MDWNLGVCACHRFGHAMGKSETGRKVEVSQIWWRFPKFVIGFLVASIVVTWAVGSASYGDFNRIVRPALVAPIAALRTWAFTFCFLSIGLTTRLREFAPTGGKLFVAFTADVVFNVILGFVLSVLVFGHYWGDIEPMISKCNCLPGPAVAAARRKFSAVATGKFSAAFGQAYLAARP
jgi:Conserved hypothetical protein 698